MTAVVVVVTVTVTVAVNGRLSDALDESGGGAANERPAVGSTAAGVPRGNQSAAPPVLDSIYRGAALLDYGYCLMLVPGRGGCKFNLMSE